MDSLLLNWFLCRLRILCVHWEFKTLLSLEPIHVITLYRLISYFLEKDSSSFFPLSTIHCVYWQSGSQIKVDW